MQNTYEVEQIFSYDIIIFFYELDKLVVNIYVYNGSILQSKIVNDNGCSATYFICINILLTFRFVYCAMRIHDTPKCIKG